MFPHIYVLCIFIYGFLKGWPCLPWFPLFFVLVSFPLMEDLFFIHFSLQRFLSCYFHWKRKFDPLVLTNSCCVSNLFYYLHRNPPLLLKLFSLLTSFNFSLSLELMEWEVYSSKAGYLAVLPVHIIRFRNQLLKHSLDWMKGYF